MPSSSGLPDPGIEPRFPTLQEDSLPSESQGSPVCVWGSPYRCAYVCTHIHILKYIIQMYTIYNTTTIYVVHGVKELDTTE